ncbi:hypothetical protein [Streptomyces flavalbus]|uniref:Uncharacterized protein n=1 Tax=Streptomyces flavalbus TaxID=2665155 RepID=A0ABW2W5F7_9ACTN
MSTPGFRPTHVVPRDGLPAWEAPDPARPTVSLDPLLPVVLAERRGDWGRIECANGWSAWVDGRCLVAVPDDPPTTGGPLAASADPRPLLARAEQALAGYRAAVEDLAAGRLDGESFQHRTSGLRLGVVADGESLWLYDGDESRWLYTDGTRLNTYATDDSPHTTARPTPTPAHPPPASAHPPPASAQPAPASAQPQPTRVEPAPVSTEPPPTTVEPAPAVEPSLTTAEPPPTTVDPAPTTAQPPHAPDDPGYAPTRIVGPDGER